MKIRWAIAILAVFGTSLAFASSYSSQAWSVRVTMKNGDVKTGYVDFSFDYFDGILIKGTKDFEFLKNYPRKSEIPNGGCYECSDQVFLLWTDYILWATQRGHQANWGGSLRLVGSLVPITAPVTLTAIVKESVQMLPLSEIQSIELDPSRQNKTILDCDPVLARAEIDTLRRKKALHSIHDLGEGGSYYLTYDPQVGPVEWLKSCFAVSNHIEYFQANVDGYSLGKLTVDLSYEGGEPDPNGTYLTAGNAPDTPMFRSLDGLMKQKCWQETHLRPDPIKYAEYSKEHFGSATAKPLPGFIEVGFDCAGD